VYLQEYILSDLASHLILQDETQAHVCGPWVELDFLHNRWVVRSGAIILQLSYNYV